MSRRYENQPSLNQFTDDEIREQLECLGFKNVPRDKFKQFKKDLEKLITQEASMNSTNASDHSARPKYEDEEVGAFKYKMFPLSAKASSYQDLNERISKSKRVTFPNDSQIVSQEESDSEQSFVSITTTNSIVNNKVLKRKVIRKSNGLPEQKTPEIPAMQPSSNGLHERLELDETLNESDEDSEESFGYAKHDQVDSDDEQFGKINECYHQTGFPIKSFIRSQSSLSVRSDSSRGAGLRSNPVQKYQEYQKVWNKHKAPGEKRHNDLRWSIREQMLEKHVIIKKQPKVFTPNTYAIPTEKKRQNLRWAVRNALANAV